MTPEEKAKEILYKYARIVPGIDYGDLYECDWETAKACAIEEVNEILKILSGLLGNIVVTTGQSCEDTQKLIEFYKCVKQEIEKL